MSSDRSEGAVSDIHLFKKKRRTPIKIYRTLFFFFPPHSFFFFVCLFVCFFFFFFFFFFFCSKQKTKDNLWDSQHKTSSHGQKPTLFKTTEFLFCSFGRMENINLYCCFLFLFPIFFYMFSHIESRTLTIFY